MLKYKKGQNAIEFMVILIFVFIIIGLIMYFTGHYIVDLKDKEKEQKVNDFASIINKELEILSKVEDGYSREIAMHSNDYNLSFEGGYIIINDIYNENDTYYYPVAYDYNISLRYELIEGVNMTVLTFKKEQKNSNKNYLQLN